MKLPGAVIPHSLSRRVCPYNFVGHILKILECLGLESTNSCRKKFDKFTKISLKLYKLRYIIGKLVKNGIFFNHSPTILGKEILISD